LAQAFLETRLSSQSLESLIDFLAYLRQKLWLKNSAFDKNQEVSQKVLFALSGLALASHNLAAD